MAYTFNQKNWVAGEVITANGVNRIEECLGHLVDEKQNTLYFDAVPTAGSSNLVDSNGIYNALSALNTFIIDRRPTSDSRNAVQSRGIYEALLGKQDLLIFDSTPKSSSSNPVTSQGIYQALSLKQNNLTFDSTPISDSNNPVTSKGIYQALSLKQDKLTFDNTPNSGSNNPVTSNGIYRALSLKQNNLTFDSTPTINSSNPVTSEGIYISLQNLLGEVNNSLDDLSNSFYQELITKQNKLTFDSVPDSGSNNPVTSQGIYQALNLKQDKLTFDNTPKNNSNNPVTSNGIYDVLQEIELKIPNAQVQSDWNITDSTSKAYIKNKPLIPTKTSQLTNDSGFLTAHQDISEKADKSTTVSNIAYDAINKKIIKVINGIVSTVVETEMLKSDMALIKVENKSSATIRSEITSKNVTDALGFTPTSNTGTVTSVITGIGLTGGNITGSGTIKAKLKSETALINDSAAAAEISNRVYPIAVDKSGYLAVNVPWTDSKPVTSVAGKTGAVTLVKGDIGLGNVDNKSSATIRSEITSSNVTTALGFTPLDASLKGANSGIAELDSNGKIPSSQLPSYVDDVLEYSAKTKFPSTGETGKIYVDTATNKTYRWSGSDYIEISASLALGTTSSTAYRGDYGNAAYAHAVTNKGSAFSSGLYKITTNSEGHVTAAIAVVKSDITGLGIPGSDTTYTFDGTYNASTNKAATVSTITNAIAALNISDKADKNATVSTVSYNATSKKITKTINGITTDVISVATLKTDMSLNNVENKNSATIRGEITSSNITTALGFIPLDATLKGANNGIAELDSSGKVPSSQLPAYVDNILEYNSFSNFPATGEAGKIYVDKNTNLTYRWSGSTYVAISSSLALGTTSSTAFRGDYGNIAYTHAVNKGSAFSSGLYKITTNSEGHVIAATAVTKADITALGISPIQVQSDWEEEDTESKAYIKNRPIIPNSKSQYSLENLHTNQYSTINNIKIWHFFIHDSTSIPLIVGNKYKIQINDNIYEEYFSQTSSNYYFVGTELINKNKIVEKDFGISFDKINEDFFNIKKIYFKESDIQKFSITINESLIGRQYLDIPDWSKEPTKPTYTASEVGAIPITEKGISGGVATLDENGIVPSSQLPAYVDTILEYNTLSNFPSIGESGKIYVALDTNKSYRWSGIQYTEISSSISLGEVQGTAYEGHKGKANALAINDLQNNKANKSTTISGYGIIDAKIENGTITLGNNTIQPIVDNNYNHTDNNFTNEEKNKLAQINIEAEKNIQSDWNITDINSDAYIKNKPNITNTITENSNNLVISGAIYTELIKKQDDLINVPEVSEIKPTDYIFIERNRTIYKILASKLGTFTPDESDLNAITDENGNSILDENGNEIIIDTNTTDTVVTNDGKIILTEDQKELNLG